MGALFLTLFILMNSFLAFAMNNSRLCEFWFGQQDPFHIRSPLNSTPQLEIRDIHWTAEHILLRERLKNADNLLNQLKVSSDKIVHIDDSIMGDDSTRAWGVFRVETPQGTKALKVLTVPMDTKGFAPYDPSSLCRDQLFIQLQLGELGAAVPVQGWLDLSALEDLRRRFPHVFHSHRGDFQWAILMDYVPQGWNPKPRNNRMDLRKKAPDYVREWDLKKLKTEVIQIGRVLKYLGVRADDLQFIFNREGRPFLIDVELYHIDERDRLTGPAYPLRAYSPAFDNEIEFWLKTTFWPTLPQ